MTRREKVLAMFVGGALGGLALYGLVRWAVLGPFNTVRTEITHEQDRRLRLNKSLRRLDHVEDDWKALTARTFATDAKEAERRFREDMHQLLERHGLHDPKVSPGSAIKYKDGSIGVPLTISATGTLNKVVGFLCDFYRREYLARLDKVRITAEPSVVSNVNSTRGRGGGAVRQGRVQGGPPGRAAAEVGPDGPELKVNISAVTLVLQKFADIDHPVLKDVVEDPNGRLLRELSEYNYIFDKNLFMPYQPKPVVVAQAPPATKPDGQAPPAPPPPPPPPPPPRPDAEYQYVRGSTRLDGEETAYVYDERKKGEPPAEYHVDQPIDDGKLLLILPLGLVVRVEKPGSPTLDYFYPLGKCFKDREDVNPDDHPEIINELEREGLLWDPKRADGTAAARP